MNNKGFTLAEVLLSISVISILVVILTFTIGGTFGLSSDKSYEIIERSIINQVDKYIYECDNGLIECNGDYTWNNNSDSKSTSFYLDVMTKYSYFNEYDLINPKTNENISKCLKINVVKDNLAVLDISLDNSECK